MYSTHRYDAWCPWILELWDQVPCLTIVDIYGSLLGLGVAGKGRIRIATNNHQVLKGMPRRLKKTKQTKVHLQISTV